MKYERESHTQPLTKEFQNIYKTHREEADKTLWNDALKQEVEKDVLDFLQVLRNEIEESVRR